MKSNILITEVKQVEGFIHEFSNYNENPNRYNSSKHLTGRSYEPIALFVKGVTETGENISFYSPNVVLTVTTGFVGFTSMDDNN